MLNAPIRDPGKTKRSAARALADVDQALKQAIAKNQDYATAENDAKAFKSMNAAADEKGPVADAQRHLAKASSPRRSMSSRRRSTVRRRSWTPRTRRGRSANATDGHQLQQMAANQQVQQQIQQQLQQKLGMNQQQAQQAAPADAAAVRQQGGAAELQQQAQQIEPADERGKPPISSNSSSPAGHPADAGAGERPATGAADGAGRQQMGRDEAAGAARSERAASRDSRAASQAGQQMAQVMPNMQQQLQAMQAMRRTRSRSPPQNAGCPSRPKRRQRVEQRSERRRTAGADQGQCRATVQVRTATRTAKWNGQPGQGGGGVVLVIEPTRAGALFDQDRNLPLRRHRRRQDPGFHHDQGTVPQGRQKVSRVNRRSAAEQEATDEIEDEHISGSAKQAVKDTSTPAEGRTEPAPAK